MDQMLSAIKYLYPEIYEVMAENILSPKENLRPDLINEQNYNDIISEINQQTQKIADE